MPKSIWSRRHALAALAAWWMPAAQAAAESSSPGFDLQPWPRGRAAPAFPATDMTGQAVSLQALRGKVVLVNFWASWCEPCRAEMPSLQALAEREKAQLVVLTINLKESPEAIARFVQSTVLTLPVLRDPLGDTARAWGIKIYPSTVLVDPAGQVRSVVRGALDWAGAEGETLWRPLLRAEPQRTPKR
ncbi:TlpA family protein disulfide reductase [Rhodoferax mekongensis]|uniref:TlpA disulfide reductase family protein n=1 Tax=Rhodoferax mekongensis TaxID=3068341 RepID=A0ABZ0AXU3_9BURK|nr:TlpA disulfide reductase family protein [Rhodoferax sp. TBRC 17307]WNO04115.1 TlpA disulfide reductase family protein [Rhodoferax sp. TBRC 17307]